MSRQRHSAVIYKKKDGTFGIEIRNDKPMPPEGVQIIEIMHRRDDESLEAFSERAQRYLTEEYQDT